MRCSRFSVLLLVIAGVSPITLPAQTSPAAGAMRVACSNRFDDLVVEPHATMQCTAIVNGRPAMGVEWRVNDIPGGNELLGTIGADGIYHAPGEGPGRERVNIEAFDLKYKTEASAPLFITKISEHGPDDHCVPASGGESITLGEGASVQFPAGILPEGIQVRVQLIYARIQPTNGIFQGVSRSLLIRFCDRFGKPFTGPIIKQKLRASAQQIVFHLPTSLDYPKRDVHDLLGVLDVYDDGDNYYALLPQSETEDPVELTADPTMVADPWFIQVGLTTFMRRYDHPGIGWMQAWNKKTSTFADVSADFCPSGRTMVLVHGMMNSPAGSFDPDNASENSVQRAAANYDTVVAFDYKWWLGIDESAASLTDILNQYVDTTRCKYHATFDIEAHSEGTVVVLASAVGRGGHRLTADAIGRIKHIVLVAGPVEGTPLANNVPLYLTLLLNVPTPKLWTVLVPVALHEMMPFIDDLRTDSPLLHQIRAAMSQNLVQKPLIVAAGDRSLFSSEAVSWAWHHALLNAVPNDGAVPVSSALIQSLQLPHLKRLVGNDPHLGDNAYALNHTSLVNDPLVMGDIERALQ